MTPHVETLTDLRRVLLLSVLLTSIFLLNAGAALAQGDVDANTVFLARFEDSLTAEQGQTPIQNSGVTFADGILGRGVLVDGADLLTYPTSANFNMFDVTIEFWVKPLWDAGNDNQARTFFSWGLGPGNDLVLRKDEAGKFTFIIRAIDTELSRSYSLTDWHANEWHHIAVTRTNGFPSRMITYIDGSARLFHSTNAFDWLPLPPDFHIGSRSDDTEQADCVIDELRVSNIRRTPQEIRDRYLLVQVNSISVGMVTKNLWKTWRIKTTVTANGAGGTANVPPSVVSWSSSNPSVATVNSTGEVVGVGAGSAVLTANVYGKQASVTVNVRAPAIEPRVNVVSNYLATPAPGALYEMPVVILRYLPTADGQNLDVAWAPDFFFLNPIPLSQLEQNLDLYDPILKFSLEEGSRFRDYGNHTTPPSLGYRVVASITVYEPSPPGQAKIVNGVPLYDADWFQIFERFGIQDYVNNLGVKEIWYYTGGVQPNIPSYDPAIHPPENMREGWETNMSSPTTGDVSNSNRSNTDLPIYNKTYIVVGRNIRRLDPVTIHGDGHQLESMLEFANRQQTGNSEMFWEKFAGLTTNHTWQRGGCGDTHHPPNALTDYEYNQTESFPSSIMDWKPDGGGQIIHYRSATHINVPYQFPNNFLGTDIPEPHWHIFWRQSMPGRGNTIPFGANRMTNWWQFVGDWDAANRAGIGLYEPASCNYSLSESARSFAADGGSGSVTVQSGSGCRWMATSNAPWIKITSGDTSNNGNTAVSFSVAANPGAPRTATLVIAGQVYTLTQAPLPPMLLTEQGSSRSLTLDSVTQVRDPFSLFNPYNFSSDSRTRVSLFAANFDLLPGEGVSVVTVQAEDSQHRIFPLAVEFVGKVPNFSWLTQINVRLPDELANAGNLSITVSLRGVASNKTVLTIGP